MTFYEVHDGDGCLTKTRDLRTAKQAAAAYLTMKSGRKLHIQIYTDGPAKPIGRIRLDPSTRIWSRPEPCGLDLGRRVETEPANGLSRGSAAAAASSHIRMGRSLVPPGSGGHEKQLPV
jgi:hypothetical protein